MYEPRLKEESWEHRTVKTKVMCTLGPTSSSLEMIKELIENGMSLVRLNMVHASHEVYSFIYVNENTG